MTLAANLLLCRGGAKLPRQISTVLVMAVGAPYELFVHAMAEGPREFGARLLMASVAELGLRHPQQVLLLFKVVDCMAVEAGDAAGLVHGAPEVGMLFTVLMAGEAALRNLRRLHGAKADNFFRIAESVGVLLAGPVAALASLVGRPATIERRLPMRRGFEAFVKFNVTFAAAL